MNILTVEDVREWFKEASDEQIIDFLYEGLEGLIGELEDDDYFGTEGFNKRYA